MSDSQQIHGLSGFIQCPRCGSDKATLNVKPKGTNPPRRQFRGYCPECGRNTGWVQL